MNYESYVTCFVPRCSSTSIATSNKLFFNVPKGEIRKKWIEKCRGGDTSLKSKKTICEDHFQLEQDVEDWQRYHILKVAGEDTFRLKLKKGVLPSRFDCQPDRKSCHTKEVRRVIEKRQAAAAIEEALKEYEEGKPSLEDKSDESVENHCEAEGLDFAASLETDDLDTPYQIGNKFCRDFSSQVNMSEENGLVDFACQVQIRLTVHSEEIQTEISALPPAQLIKRSPSTKRIEEETRLETVKPNASSSKAISAPPVKRLKLQKPTAAVSTPLKKMKRTRPEESEDSVGDTSDLTQPADSSFVPDSSDVLDCSNQEADLSTYSAGSSIEEYHAQLRKATYVAENIQLMERYPRTYLGLSVDTLCVVAHLEKATQCSRKRIMIVLRKLRLNECIEILGHVFGISKAAISNAFTQTIPILSDYLSGLIFWPSKEITRANVPIAFMANFSNVQSIIDCFEVEIEKPTDAFIQAKTWSNYKNCNTIKYLVSCTPDGFINYISRGYGGRTTDAAMVEESEYLDILAPFTMVMADRGFKKIEEMLHLRQCSLVRPPSVPSGHKLSKDEVIFAKQVASLRIHVERVIRKIREFAFLGPHACFHHNLMRYVDHFTIIACALCNLQGPIIL